MSGKSKLKPTQTPSENVVQIEVKQGGKPKAKAKKK